ncbi:uncharacterized protein LOC144630499 isoform X1 [Oculina patagonica]
MVFRLENAFSENAFSLRKTRSTSSLLQNSYQVQGCTCRCLGKCATIQCQCKKRHFSCSKDCGCKTWKCTNRQQAVPILGITSGSDDENESSPRSNTKKKKN